MRLEIQNVAAVDLCHATSQGWEDRVNSLLASGLNPHAQFEPLDSAPAELADENYRSQVTCPPQFAFDFTKMPALRLADRWGYGVDARETNDLAKTARLMIALLKHGADPYGLFPQPIFRYKLKCLIPGDAPEMEYDDDDSDLTAIKFARRAFFNETLRQEYNQLGLIGDIKAPNSPSYGFRDFRDHINFEPRFIHKHGACSVLHSLIEAGSFIQPILGFLGERLEIERRDTLGRTLFLAACRSTLGLDAAVDGFFMSLQYPDTLPNPYPRSGNPWQETGRFNSICTGPTLLEFFVSRGADLLAVDKFDQNALHHLFAFIDRSTNGIPPLINTSLRYLIHKFPSLINQPDIFGAYPLHYAIRRMCDYWASDSALPGYAVEVNGFVPRSLFHLENAVYDLIATGADLLVRDGRGNTVLHYLAACRLGEGDRTGDEQRRLLSLFLQRRFNPKARNADGVTALEMLFSTKYDRWFEDEERDYDQFYAIRREIVDTFEKAGYRLTETDTANQNLLHLVAQLDSDRARPWFDPLRARGLSVEAEDNKGENPLDIAKRNEWINL